MEKRYLGFEGLEVYQSARAFRMKVSDVAKLFPHEEKYILTNQLLRSVRSITANIAEGYGRYHYQEFLQFCRMARGSLNESLEHLICAADENYVTPHELESLRNDYDHLLRLLNGFMKYLIRQKQTSAPITHTTITTNTTNSTNTTNE